MKRKHSIRNQPSCSTSTTEILRKKREKYHARSKKTKRNESVRKKRKYNSSSPNKKRIKLDVMKKKYIDMPLIEKNNYRKKYREKYQNKTVQEKKEYISTIREKHDVNENVINNYFSKIKNGPTHICICCGGLWFKTQIKIITQEVFNSLITEDFKQKIINEKLLNPLKEIVFCKTCYMNIKKNQIPKLALWNGLDYPLPPKHLPNPTRVEERFFSPRLPFLQIKYIGRERQYGLKGQLVNIPITVDTTIKTLPRTMSETFTIQLHIKRKLSYKHDYMCEVVRPGVIYKWTKFLEESELYKKLGVKINEDWSKFDDSFTIPFICDENDRPIFQEIMNSNSKNN